MAVFEKLLLRKGIYESPQGRFDATPRRLRHFVKQFQEMQRQGIKIPVCWGHQPKAEPGDDDERARKQYYLSHFNAGYLDDLSYNSATGRLHFKGDVPGCEIDSRGNLITECTLPDGRKVKSAVGEVSAAVKDWRDGQGRLWKDSIIHVAITPLPVVAGQDGFRSLGTEDGFAGWMLSLADWRHELATEIDSEDDMAEPNEDDLDEANQGEPDEDETPPAAEIPPEQPPVPTAAPPGYAEVIEGLQKLGVHLPPHTTPENFFAHAAIAFHVLEKASEQEEDEDKEGHKEPEAPEAGGNEPAGQGPIEEQRPVMMSLASATDPTHKKIIQRDQISHRARQLRRVDRLAKTALVPAHRLERLRGAFAGYELSVDAEFELVPQTADRELDLLEEIVKESKGAKAAGKVLLGTVGTEAVRPTVEDKVDEKEIEERAAKVSAKKAA